MPEQTAQKALLGEPLLQPGLEIAADSCSLIFLNRLHLLEAYTAIHTIVLTQKLFDEIMHRPANKNTQDDPTLYKKLFSEKILSEPCSNASRGELPVALSTADVSLLHLHETRRLDGILTDDKGLCQYCKKHAVPYINTPMALFILLYNSKLSHNQYNDALHALYAMGRYGKYVRQHMEKLYSSYCTFADRAQ